MLLKAGCIYRSCNTHMGGGSGTISRGKTTRVLRLDGRSGRRQRLRISLPLPISVDLMLPAGLTPPSHLLVAFACSMAERVECAGNIW